jgi:hypothetical protein
MITSSFSGLNSRFQGVLLRFLPVILPSVARVKPSFPPVHSPGPIEFTDITGVAGSNLLLINREIVSDVDDWQKIYLVNGRDL